MTLADLSPDELHLVIMHVAATDVHAALAVHCTCKALATPDMRGCLLGLEIAHWDPPSLPPARLLKAALGIRRALPQLNWLFVGPKKYPYDLEAERFGRTPYGCFQECSPSVCEAALAVLALTSIYHRNEGGYLNVNLNGCNIGDGNVHLLRYVLAGKQVSSLHVAGCGLTDAGAHAIAAFVGSLPSNTRMHELSIRRNPISGAGVDACRSALPHAAVLFSWTSTDLEYFGPGAQRSEWPKSEGDGWEWRQKLRWLRDHDYDSDSIPSTWSSDSEAGLESDTSD